MLINISELLSTDFKKETFNPEIEMKWFKSGRDQYRFLEKPSVTLNIENEGKSRLHIYGSGEAVLDIPCSRCLTSVPTEIVYEFDHMYDPGQSEEERLDDLDSDTSFIEENLLDVDRFVYNEILFNFPMKVLCKEDCLGICPSCGRNLNDGPCECSEQSQDLRMSAFQDIFKNFKEV